MSKQRLKRAIERLEALEKRIKALEDRINTTDPSEPLSLAKHEAFAQLYVNNQSTFGNATVCYALVYGFEIKESPEVGPEKAKANYNTCSVNGAKMLGRTKVRNRVNWLMDQLYNEINADRQTAYVMQQNHNLGAKMLAVKEFNRVQQRVESKMKVEHTTTMAGFLDQLTKAAEDGNTTDQSDVSTEAS